MLRRMCALVGSVMVIASMAVVLAEPAGAAGEFSVNPTTVDFGTVEVGTTKEFPVVITNTGATAETPNFAGGAPNDPTNFSGSQNCAGVELAAGATCEFTYTFTPTTEGTHSTSTTIGIDATNYSLTFTGVGTATTTTTTTANTTTTAPTTVSTGAGSGSGTVSGSLPAGTTASSGTTTTTDASGATAAEDDDDSGTSPWLIVAIVVGIGLVVAAIAYLMGRRRRAGPESDVTQVQPVVAADAADTPNTRDTPDTPDAGGAPGAS